MTPKNAGRRVAKAAKSSGWLGLAGGSALSVVVGFLLLAPAAAGPIGYYRAPYTAGTAIQVGLPTVNGNGAKVLINVAPMFSLSTGFGQEKIQVIAPGPGPTFAMYTSRIGVGALPYTPASSGSHVLTAVWSLSFHAELALVAPSHVVVPGVFGHVDLRAMTYLVEKSTGQVVQGSTVSQVILSHTVTNGKFVEVQIPTMYGLIGAPLTLAANHVYLITTVLVLDLIVQVAPGAAQGSSMTGLFELTGPTNGLDHIAVL